MKWLCGIAFLLLPVVCVAQVPVEQITRDRILSAGPEWQRNYDSFQPKPELIEALKSRIQNGLKIDIYLGLWCPDSRNHVPPFIKILDQIGTPVPVRYFGVGRKSGKDIRYYADKARVERVPTFIFFRGDREIGRIVENPNTGLCQDMLAILSQ
jgi:hypothetical protein